MTGARKRSRGRLDGRGLPGQVDVHLAEGWTRCDLVELSTTLDLAALLPVREAAEYPGQRNLPGHFFSQTMRRRLPYESVNERNALIALDLDSDVSIIAVQPFKVWLEPPRLHVPDIAFEDGQGRRVVVDVTTRERLARQPKLAALHDEVRGLCLSAGCGFTVVLDTDFAPDYLINLQWFASFRRSSGIDWEIAERLRGTCDEPRAIGDVLAAAGVPESDARPVLFHLVAAGQLAVDMTRPITNASLIWRTASRSHQAAR